MIISCEKGLLLLRQMKAANEGLREIYTIAIAPPKYLDRICRAKEKNIVDDFLVSLEEKAKLLKGLTLH